MPTTTCIASGAPAGPARRTRLPLILPGSAASSTRSPGSPARTSAPRHSRPGRLPTASPATSRRRTRANGERRQRPGAGPAPERRRSPTETHRRQPRRCREARPPDPEAPETTAAASSDRPQGRRTGRAGPHQAARTQRRPRRGHEAERPAPPRSLPSGDPGGRHGRSRAACMRRAVPNARLLPKLTDD